MRAVGVVTMMAGGLLGGLLSARPRAGTLAQAAPTWNIDFNASGYNIERAACVAVKVGASAGTECGDLRVVHELPAVRIFNTRLAPTLLYNSAHAHPVVTIPLVITLAATTNRPDSVQVIVRAGPTPTTKTARDTAYWAGADWPAGATVTRRVTATWDALNDTTGLYFYEVEVANMYPGGVRIPNTVVGGGSTMIVNRKTSPFGAGWWLAGLEQIKKVYTSDPAYPQYLWVGGDGSTRTFIVPFANAYDRLDSLTWNATTQLWTRRLAEGRRVEFNAAGQHLRTINRFNRITQYTYSGGSLTAIALPSPTNLTYSLAYNANGVATIVAPNIGSTARNVALTISGGTLTGIKNPGDSLVQFQYLAAPRQFVMSQRTDRRGIPTTFTYDSAFKLRTSTVNPGAGAAAIVWTVKAGESRGVAKDGVPAAVDTMPTGTRIDGPRTDVADTTHLFQERFGSPRRLVDATGATTHLRRRYLQNWWGWDEGWLLWRLERPVGTVAAPETHVQRFVYEYPRGNITMVKDSGSAAAVPADSTRYEWDQSFDQLKKVTPMLGNVTEYGINTSNGRREWQQDARGMTARITYGYDEASYPEQVSRVVLPAAGANPAATYTYQYLTPLRNTYREITPRGLTTTYTPDPVGRVTLIETPIDSLSSSIRFVQRRLGYSLRDDLTGDTTQTANVTPFEATYVRTYYNAEGATDSVERRFTPDQAAIGTLTLRWRHDNAGRPVAAVAVDGKKDSTVYDPAGNAVKALNRRFVAGTVDSAQYVATTFDALNRPLQRRIPAYQYAARAEGIGGNTIWYPQQTPYPAYLIPEDVQTFVYDQAGAIKQANNRYAQVARGYSRGRLVVDTLRIADVAAASFAQHVYVNQYRYDRNGRRSVLKYPSQLVAAGQDSARYGYNSWNSDLASVVDPQGNTWAFTYDQRDQLVGLYSYSTQAAQTWKYSNEGDVLLDSVYTPLTGFPRYGANVLRRSMAVYDGRGKILRVAAPGLGAKDTLINTYSGLGYLTQFRRIQRAVASIGTDSVRYGSMEQSGYDGLGNLVTRQVRDTMRVWSSNNQK